MGYQESFAAFASEIDAGMGGYLEACPSADPDSIRAHLAFVRAVQVWTVGGTQKNAESLPQGQFVVLRLAFFTEEKRLPQSDIARSMGVTGTYVTRLIDALEERGYLERIVNADDRRVTYASLTPAGIAYCQNHLPKAIHTMETYFRDFSEDEKDQFQVLLSKLCLGIAKMSVSEVD